jgi:PEP-CTERM motif-containing protein
VGSLSGYFFFDTSQVTGGLRPVFQRPGAPPGAPGTAVVFFGAGPSGAETITFNNGSALTIPLKSGFSLFADFQAPVCGNFDDCFYSVGQVLTLNEFNAAPDPWALIFNGMTGTFGEFFPPLPPGLQGSGRFEVNSVPEPATLSLLALGLASVGFMRRRKKGQAS